jgi:excisionase family DNA binding protein
MNRDRGKAMNESKTTTIPAVPGTLEALWTPQQVAEYLKVSRSWVYQKAEAGLIPVIRLPGSSLLRFAPEAIRDFALGKWEPMKVIPFRSVSSRP